MEEKRPAVRLLDDEGLLEDRVPLQGVTTSRVQILDEGPIDQLVPLHVGAREDHQAARQAHEEESHDGGPEHSSAAVTRRLVRSSAPRGCPPLHACTRSPNKVRCGSIPSWFIAEEYRL